MHRCAFVVMALVMTAFVLPVVAGDNPQTDLKVTYNGEPVTMKTAWACMDEGELKLLFSTATPTCKEFLARGRKLASGEVYFELMGEKEEDGSWDWTTSFGARTWPAEEGTTIEITSVDTSEGGKTTGTVTTSLKACCDQPDHIEVEGSFVAIGCGGS